MLIMEREKKENTWTKGNNCCSAYEKKNGDGKKENICRRKIFFGRVKKLTGKIFEEGIFFVEEKKYLQNENIWTGF